MEKDYFVHESSFVDEGCQIGEGTKIWHFCHIQSGAKIGKKCSLGQNVNVSNNVIVGDGCKLQNNVSLYEGVVLENDVFCGPSCVFTNDLTPRAKYPKGRANYKKTLVMEGASIGANATVVCGHTVGRCALIGAGAVVACDVPDYALMLGVPGRPEAQPHASKPRFNSFSMQSAPREGGEEGLGQAVSACLLSTLPNQTPGLPYASYKEVTLL